MARIRTCIIGERYTNEINELNALGIKTILLPPINSLDDEICNHADISVFKLDDNNFVSENSLVGELMTKLSGKTIYCCDNIFSPYPNDIKLNAARIGDRIFCNNKYVCEIISDYSEKNSLELINTNQGYTKCNICILNDNAVITEDSGIATLLKKYQIGVLKINPGYVDLSSKHYGFIGGAGVKISNTEIYFSGDISSHPDYDKIINFLNIYGFKPIFNKNRKLNDFGGFIPIN